MVAGVELPFNVPGVREGTLTLISVPTVALSPVWNVLLFIVTLLLVRLTEIPPPYKAELRLKVFPVTDRVPLAPS